MKGIYVQKGESLDYENKTGKLIEAGDVIVLEDRIGIAGTSFADKQMGSVHVTGVFKLFKASEDFEMGQDLYYSNEHGLTTEAENNIPAGYAAASADKDAPVALVKLIG